MHISVLLQEVLQRLDPKQSENFVDCTVGGGGHAVAILERTAPDGMVLGIDWDAESLQQTELRMTPSTLLGTGNNELWKRLKLAQGNFADIEKIIQRKRFGPVHGVLMDLGLSSWQIEKSGRGFSFLRDEPLDMRLAQQPTANPDYVEDPRFPNSQINENRDHQQLTATDIVNTFSAEALEKILREYGEERFARRIAAAIVSERKRKKILRAKELADLILRVIPIRFHRQRIHPATRTFQALRIAVNNELENLQKGLAGALKALGIGGRLAVISFHSLEDRIVKNFFRAMQRNGRLRILTKKPLVPSMEEMTRNPRSRSAKLRCAIKCT